MFSDRQIRSFKYRNHIRLQLWLLLIDDSVEKRNLLSVETDLQILLQYISPPLGKSDHSLISFVFIMYVENQNTSKIRYKYDKADV
jgi:hypothetical protein